MTPAPAPRDRIQRASLVVLAAIAAFVALRLGRDVFAPMLLGLVIGVVLAPISDLLSRIGLPRVLSTVLTIFVGVGAMVALGLMLEPLIWRVIDQAPLIWAQLRETMLELQALLGGLDEVASDMAETVGAGDGEGAEQADEDGVAIPSMMDAMLFAPTVIAQLLIFVGTLFFFILSRVEVYAYLSRHRIILERPRDITRTLIAAERRVSRYFLTITVINAVFGCLVAGAMWLIGMPTPYVWGLLAFLVNYILYLGPITYACVLVIAGSMNFTGLTVFAPAAVYLAMNATEGQFVTPALVGRTLRVNPLLVFLSLVFFLWLWGPLGGFVAIPLLVWVLAVATGFKGEREQIEAVMESHADELPAPAE